MIETNASSVVTSTARAIDGAISRLVQGVNASSWNPAAEADRFHGIREKTLTVLSEVNVEQAMWSPRSGVWSIAQIADHLLLTEEMYREQFERLLEMGREGRNTSIEISLSEVDVGLVMVPREIVPFFEIPLKMFNLFVPHVVRETFVRYPLLAALNPKASAPREVLSLDKLREDLALSLEATEYFFRTPMPHNIHDLTINHPIMGNNSIPQLFRIVMAHEERHQAQMADLRAHANFPKISREPMNAADLLGGRGY
jgi:uncharacterized damage-inducible protein DinB